MAETSIEASMMTPVKPANWEKPDKKYGGAIPQLIAGPGEDPDSVRPDLSRINEAIVARVRERKEIITKPGYSMKISDCPLRCCQYLHTQEEEQEQKVIIKKVIRRRRKNQNDAEPPAQPNQQQQQAAAQAEAQQEAVRRQQEAEAERQRQEAERQRQQQEAERQRQEAERKRQEELQRQKEIEEQRRQQQADAEAERQRQQQEEAERQRQAAAAAAAPPAAAPTQKVATFQNLGTDPAMATAELYYESTRWGPIGHGDPPISIGTFPGHRWFIVANGVYAKLFTVGEEAQQTFKF